MKNNPQTDYSKFQTTKKELEFLEESVKKNLTIVENYYEAIPLRAKWEDLDKDKIIKKCEELLKIKPKNNKVYSAPA